LEPVRISSIAFSTWVAAALLPGAAACGRKSVPQAQPSPLLDALSLAPSALMGARCRPDRLVYGESACTGAGIGLAPSPR
jgi:hypothetical protein